MIKFASIPHSDSVLLYAISLGRLMRSHGHDFRLAIDPSAAGYPLMTYLAELEGEEITPIESLYQDPPDVVFFESSAIAPHAFGDFFRINFNPGVIWNQRYSLFIMGTFSLGNISFAANYLDPYIKKMYGGDIPELGSVNASNYPRPVEKKTILFPDGCPMNFTARRAWFPFLEKVALNNPEYDVIIKERFPEDYYAHVSFDSYRSFFTSDTPSNLKVVSYREHTKKMIAESSCVVGVASSILVEAAMIGKKVCLVDAGLPERYTGIPYTRDWFTRNGLRVKAEDAARDIFGMSRMTAESLRGFAPAPFKGDWLVAALEEIFDRFPDPNLRNALKYDLAVDTPVRNQLDLLAERSESPEIERKKNLARYEYGQSMSQAALMLNFVAPDMPNADIAEHVMNYFNRDQLPLETSECRAALDDYRMKFADFVMDEIYNPDQIDYFFDRPMFYDTPFIMPAYYLVDALVRSGRTKDAKDFEERLNFIFNEKREAPRAKYTNAVALERMQRTSQAYSMFEVLAADEGAEFVLRSGAFFHMGVMDLNSGDYQKAEDNFKNCLEQEPNHGKARFYLDQLKSGKPAACL
ncbi:tetratricopeptide repeat protein [Maridesulfovibrio sp.]|uniref:tetratricopeptide repeat protein n=1 Tax=Maridesulfovibrio sp. TaxID=2795000 RepID=UPI002A18C475|nr:tetratricopeptide repeat protein [Maridesulfovibrio sp.]